MKVSTVKEMAHGFQIEVLPGKCVASLWLQNGTTTA